MGKDRYQTGDNLPLYPKGTHPDAGIQGRDQSLTVQPGELTLSAEAVHANNIKYAAARPWWALPPRTPEEKKNFCFLAKPAEFSSLVEDGGSSILEGEFLRVVDVEGNGPGCLLYAERIPEESKKPIVGSKSHKL
jgi:hypothetical protein